MLPPATAKEEQAGRVLIVKTYNIPSENVQYCISLNNSRLTKTMFVNKYYPCGKFEIYGVENQNKRDSVSIWTNGYFEG